VNFALVEEYLPEIWQGFLQTILLALSVIALASVLAFASALAREYRVPVAHQFATGYVTLFRALPALLTVYLTFYALPQLGLRLRPFTASVVGMTLYTGAYLSQDVRAGLAAVGAGQHDAARALGLPPWHMVRRIILPQAMPILLPPYVTSAIQAVKGTSIAALIGVREITMVTMGAMSVTFAATEFLAVAAVLYLLLSGVLAILQIFIERHLRRHLQLLPLVIDASAG
jgi:His/Glu/Gln/Arg/opine family amino acid ABC transporter permease subunit